MADLLDIAPSTACEAVRFDGNRVIVRGLNGPAIAAIAARFPEIIGLLFGAGAAIGPKSISQLGAAIGPIIAAGCGHLGDEKYEQHASALSLEIQIKLVVAIIGLTAPNELISFVEKLTARLTKGAGEGAPVVRVRLRKSPSPSQPSSDTVSHRIM